MKKKYLFIDFFEFLLVFFAFVGPSLSFQRQEVVYFNLSYDLFFILLRLVALIYFLVILYDKGFGFIQEWSFTIHSFFRVFFESIRIYVCILILGILSSLTANLIGYSGPELIAQPPNTSYEWTWFVFSVIVLACFEEALYRQFIPEKLYLFFNTIIQERNLDYKWSKILRVIIELLSLCIFAIGHLYLGYFAAVSAFFSGCVFRYATIKHNSILQTSIAHSINNLVSFILVFYLNASQ